MKMRDLVENKRENNNVTINKKGLKKMLEGEAIEIHNTKYELTEVAIKSVRVLD